MEMVNDKLVLKIEGMSCGGCVGKVEKALRTVPGVKTLQVGVGSAHLTFDGERPDGQVIAGVIEKAGFRLAPSA